jgi:hypothetical protein
LIDLNAQGGASSTELQRMLSESENKLREALNRISDMEGNMLKTA